MEEKHCIGDKVVELLNDIIVGGLTTFAVLAVVGFIVGV